MSRAVTAWCIAFTAGGLIALDGGWVSLAISLPISAVAVAVTFKATA